MRRKPELSVRIVRSAAYVLGTVAGIALFAWEALVNGYRQGREERRRQNRKKGIRR